MDNNLTSKNFKEFLQQNGYNWSGYLAEDSEQEYERYYPCGKFKNSLNDRYILLGSVYDWDEDYGFVKVWDNDSVKYIQHDDIVFHVYKSISGGKFELEKDLSAEWVRYQALNVEGYIEETLFGLRHVLASSPKFIQDRKNALAQEIERITREANFAIKAMEEDLARSKMAVETIRQVQEERLIKKQIELGAKDDFKDNVDNDMCLQHLTDTFGK